MVNVWSFGVLGGIVSSGLGGGSLIYGNVLIRRDPKTFVTEEVNGGGWEYWPVYYEDLEPHYESVEQMLNGQPYPFEPMPEMHTRSARSAALLSGGPPRLKPRRSCPPAAPRDVRRARPTAPASPPGARARSVAQGVGFPPSAESLPVPVRRSSEHSIGTGEFSNFRFPPFEEVELPLYGVLRRCAKNFRPLVIRWT